MDDETTSNFSLKFETPEGEQVVVKVTYPQGKGLLGVQGLREAASVDYQYQVLALLLEEGDPSTVKSYDDYVISEIEEKMSDG